MFIIMSHVVRTNSVTEHQDFDTWLEARNFLASFLSRNADSIEIGVKYRMHGTDFWIEKK